MTGLVVSQGKMNKTVKVRVMRRKFNPVINKNVVVYKDMLVHDELNKCQEGDVVRILYVRPLSARKSFAVSEVLKYQGTEWMKYRSEAPGKVRSEEADRLRSYMTERQQREQLGGVDPAVRDLETIEKAQGDAQAAADARIAELKQKYGITTWPPTGEIVQLNMNQLKKELETLGIEISRASYASVARDMIANEPARAAELLRSLGKNPDELSPSMKKNMLMKHFASTYAKA